jgi:hypothetical protein
VASPRGFASHIPRISLPVDPWLKAQRSPLAPPALGAGPRGRFALGCHLLRRRARCAGVCPGLNGGWDAVALIYFVCCGVSRLARFNVTAETLAAGSDSGKVAYFEGTPIPTSVVLTAVLAFAAWQDRIGEDVYGGAWELGPWEFHPLSLLFIASGSMMISKTPAYSEAVGGLTDLAREQPIGVKKALARRLGDASLI